MNKEYIDFIAGLKQNIIQSRYIAAKLANKEQLLLYFRTGKMLSEKIAAEKWGAKVLEQIAEDLQKALPGLKGFSYRNLKIMRQFAVEYAPFPIGSSLRVLEHHINANLYKHQGKMASNFTNTASKSTAKNSSSTSYSSTATSNAS
jgi:predicted nuclease of restriction endonuclease-like (RecB) superfamily